MTQLRRPTSGRGADRLGRLRKRAVSLCPSGPFQAGSTGPCSRTRSTNAAFFRCCRWASLLRTCQRLLPLLPRPRRLTSLNCRRALPASIRRPYPLLPRRRSLCPRWLRPRQPRLGCPSLILRVGRLPLPHLFRTLKLAVCGRRMRHYTPQTVPQRRRRSRQALTRARRHNRRLCVLHAWSAAAAVRQAPFLSTLPPRWAHPRLKPVRPPKLPHGHVLPTMTSTAARRRRD